MRLLFFVFLALHCSDADLSNLTDEEEVVIAYLEEDANGLVEKISNLTTNLKGLKPEASEVLKAFTSNPMPEKFGDHVISDFFPEKNITQFFEKVEKFLENNEVNAAIEKCVLAKTCVHPFPKLTKVSEYKNVFKTIKGKYANRTAEKKVLENVLGLHELSGNIAEKLRHLESSIKDELHSKPGAADDAIKQLSKLPTNLSLPAKADLEKSEGQPEVSKKLNDVANFLEAAKRALAVCATNFIEGKERCKSDLFPFHFLWDPSNVQAFKNMVAEYDERLPPTDKPLPTTPHTEPETGAPVTGSEPEPNTGKPNPDSSVSAAPKPDSSASSKCCQLCLLPAMPPSQSNCQSGNQCNCGCSCNSGSTRGCRTQSKCCSSNSHCKDNCCEKSHHDDKKPVVHTEVINIPPAASSSSSPMVALVSAVSLIATLMR